MSAPTVMVVGVGGMARHHLDTMIELSRLDADRALGKVVLVDPLPSSIEAGLAKFEAAGLPAPSVYTSLDEALADPELGVDLALIATPHNLHHRLAVACLEAGIDVWLEKPMVCTEAEALDLIRVRDETGRLLVISFNGSLSPQVRKARELIDAGAIGTVTGIHASVWQGWKAEQTGTWRTDPEQSGGGFMFDTGAHMLNTVSDLAGADFTKVSAWLDETDLPVDVLGSISARTATGAMVTLAGCGDTITVCESDVKVFGTKGILTTGVWGERLLLQTDPRVPAEEVEVPRAVGPWQTVLEVREGVIDNPSPAELGLRMSRLWDMVKASAARGGAPVEPTR
ncbi:Gfo/Idh/MocA family protein [Aestuariimicrobium kwangyangense]|uniref:Gfo/Idh/MocA family protein n=1 Tax=Aestuariimicrobium kwangyangense TaxID=396389 RepID=UPI0003B38DA7|nr:Gfo/Idh/MocA family oxidoreductase [Aestuariimicrobium kwangyangense]